jgi:hypothetical protein
MTTVPSALITAALISTAVKMTGKRSTTSPASQRRTKMHPETCAQLFVTDKRPCCSSARGGSLPVDVFEASRKPLHEQFPDSEPASMRFSPAPLLIKAVTLALTDKAQEENLQTVTSANFPPYSALFNVTLTPEQKSHVASALNGRTGVLKVSYVFSLSTSQR